MNSHQAALKYLLREELSQVREELTKGQIIQWLRAEVDQYLAALIKSRRAEERRKASARDKAVNDGIGELLTVRDISGILKVTPLTVRRYIKLGVLKGFKIGGRIMVPRSSLYSLLSSAGPAPGSGKA